MAFLEKDGLDDYLNTEKDEQSLMVFGRNIDESKNPLLNSKIVEPMKDLEHSIAIDSEPLEDNYLNNPFDVGM